MGTKNSSGCRLNVESLEAREVPATLTNGRLEIVGSNSRDVVDVRDVTVNGTAVVRVNHNGRVQDFRASSVSRVMCWGYGGDDSFNYHGSKPCYADGGDGNDVLCGDRGADQLIGGRGNDLCEGWGGNDELQGGDGNDTLDGGSGNDRVFGQAGSDCLGGGSGDDQLNGGSGIDMAWGGSGADQFWECRDTAYYLIPVQTRFGTAGGGGVQDANSGGGDRVYS